MAVLSWAWAFVVMLRRWEVWLKLANSKLALSRCALMESLDVEFTGSSHLHCIRVWVFWCGIGVVEGMLSAVWGMKEFIG